MAVLFPVPQFFDDSGNPLSSGLVYTYVTGTTTNKTSYKNQAESSNHTNPIVLDSSGRPPANGIWLNGAYKLVIKDSTATTTYHTLDAVNAYNPVDWTGLTATVSDLNTYAAAAGTAGTVVASKTVIVDASKNISTFGALTAATLNGTTSVQTPLIKDSNAVTAITIAATASQVNAITVTPAVTGSGPTIGATGGDTNIDLKLASKGSGVIKFNDFSFPLADGTSGQVLTTNGSKTLSFATQTGLKQFVSVSATALSTITTVLPLDNTIPQNTEGDQILSLAITPTSASSTLLFNISITSASNSTSRQVCAALFQDATANALAASAASNSVNFQYTMTSGTVSATTFKVRVGPSAAGTCYVNGNVSGTALFNGKSSTVMTIMEIL